MEVSHEPSKSLKMSHDAVTHFRWELTSFLNQLQDQDFPGFVRSDEFALSEEKANCFIELHYWNRDDEVDALSAEVSVNLLDLNDLNQCTCNFWLENRNGEKCLPVEFCQDDFKHERFDDDMEIDDDESDNSFESEGKAGFIYRKQLNFSEINPNQFFDDDCVFVCLDFRYNLSEEDYEVSTVDSDFRNGLLRAYNNKLEGDCTIQVENEEFKIPKMILAARSDVFERMFMTPNCEESQTGIVKIKDSSAEVMKKFIEYLIVGKLFDSGKFCEELFTLANKYNVVELQADCIKEVSQTMHKDNVFVRLKWAFSRDDQKLKDAILEYVIGPTAEWNFRQIQTSDEWFDFTAQNRELAKEITNAVFEKAQWLSMSPTEEPM